MEEFIEIEGRKGPHILVKPKLYKEIRILEIGFLIVKDREFEIKEDN